tara:strand:- start:373 stop:633 length:261 start_codon:yes stop_codon:yes gene_type:complete
MDINQLIEIVKTKIENEIVCDEIKIIDKTISHKNHASHQKGKFHLQIIIQSDELRSMSKLDSFRKVHKVLDIDLKRHIHSLQLKII